MISRHIAASPIFWLFFSQVFRSWLLGWRMAAAVTLCRLKPAGVLAATADGDHRPCLSLPITHNPIASHDWQWQWLSVMCDLFRAEGVLKSLTAIFFFFFIVRQSCQTRSRSSRGASRIRYTLRRGWVDPYLQETGPDRRRRTELCSIIHHGR